MIPDNLEGFREGRDKLMLEIIQMIEGKEYHPASVACACIKVAAMMDKVYAENPNRERFLGLVEDVYNNIHMHEVSRNE